MSESNQTNPMHQFNTEDRNVERVEITEYASDSRSPDAPGERERDEIRRRMRGKDNLHEEAPDQG